MKVMKVRLLCVAALAPLVAGCATFNNTEMVMPELDMPAAYEFLQAEAGNAPDPAWWSAFNDQSLNALETRAMAANNDLLAGVERVAQARASLRQAGAVYLPQVSGSQSTTFSETGGGGGGGGGLIDTNGDGIPDTFVPGGSGGGGGGLSYTENSSARVGASYELDLFGGNAASLRSSRASLASQIYNQRNLELQVQSNVATAYFNILSLQQRLESARQNLEYAERIMDLVERQYEEGAVSGFDVSRQRQQLASTQATVPQLEQQLAAAESALAILLGEYPERFDPPAGQLRTILPPPVEVGLPSDLLLRRPDLMAAEATLVGANADIDAARAAFFPTISLSANANVSDLFGAFDIATSFGESLSATIFSGGRLEGGLQRSEARYRELIINYRQAVLNAMKEVEDALVTLRTAEEREALQQIATDEAQRSFELSEARYQAGADDLQAVLDAQRQLLSAADQLVQARQQRLTAAVDLFSALGGGWQGDPEAARLAER